MHIALENMQFQEAGWRVRVRVRERETIIKWTRTTALTQSSKASLIRETKSTKLRGTTFVTGLTGLHNQKLFKYKAQKLMVNVKPLYRHLRNTNKAIRLVKKESRKARFYMQNQGEKVYRKQQVNPNIGHYKYTDKTEII